MTTPIIIRQVNLRHPYQHVAHHKFPLPGPRDPGFYRQVQSFNAFFNGAGRSARRNRSPDGFLYCEVDIRDKDRRLDWELQRDAALPVHNHKDIFAFYEAIGYDRKTKKYNLTNKTNKLTTS